jgi:ABC-type ATPase involved in cell division
MTVPGNLEFLLKMRDRSRRATTQRVVWAAELLSLGDLLDCLPKQLSRRSTAEGRYGVGVGARASGILDGRAAVNSGQLLTGANPFQA